MVRLRNIRSYFNTTQAGFNLLHAKKRSINKAKRILRTEEENVRIIQESQLLLERLINVGKRETKHGRNNLIYPLQIDKSLNSTIVKNKYLQINIENHVIKILNIEIKT